ncbi:hypothetical protein THRCLA_11722 [Thraustotheca clavata]|uniref:Uncharacterized protein n=1 Tax=Thraustotheca clavata TaxID=74557 RepID=A0A1V9Y6X8_9STRA|nr:hypothetical protein THRCLA_11722 [Thraustotheca clavata]
MTACERALLGHHTPAASLSRTLNCLSDDILQLHLRGQLDIEVCMHEFYLISDSVISKLESNTTNVVVLAALCELLRALSAIIFLCSHPVHNVAYNAKDCLSNFTIHTTYGIEPIVRISDTKFANFQEAVNYTYHFAANIPVICEKWAKTMIEPYHEDIFKLVANCMMDDNVNVRVVGFKALNALFWFQRNEMNYSATFLVESYIGALEPKMIDELVRDLPKLILAKTIAAYFHKRKIDRIATPKYKKQELIYQTPIPRQPFELKQRKEPSFLNRNRQRMVPEQSYFKKPIPTQRFQEDTLHEKNTKRERNTLWQYIRMGGRASRWLVDQIIPRQVQRWLIFWCTSISVVFTIVTLLYWLLLAS